MNLGSQNGTVAAHGRIWPLYERPAVHVEIVGSLQFETEKEACGVIETLKYAVRNYPVEIRVVPIAVLSMSPEDQAEKNRLDEESLKR